VPGGAAALSVSDGFRRCDLARARSAVRWMASATGWAYR